MKSFVNTSTSTDKGISISITCTPSKIGLDEKEFKEFCNKASNSIFSQLRCTQFEDLNNEVTSYRKAFVKKVKDAVINFSKRMGVDLPEEVVKHERHEPKIDWDPDED